MGNIWIKFWTFSHPIGRPTSLKHRSRCFELTTAAQRSHRPQTPVWLYWIQKHLLQWCKKIHLSSPEMSWGNTCTDSRWRQEKASTAAKLRPLFVNNNSNRGKRVALLQDEWSPAVCVKAKPCSALPPLPSARGRTSAFSLDPWR